MYQREQSKRQRRHRLHQASLTLLVCLPYFLSCALCACRVDPPRCTRPSTIFNSATTVASLLIMSSASAAAVKQATHGSRFYGNAGYTGNPGLTDNASFKDHAAHASPSSPRAHQPFRPGLRLAAEWHGQLDNRELPSSSVAAQVARCLARCPSLSSGMKR